MNTDPFRNHQLDPKQVIESITLKKILKALPEVSKYKTLIRFYHENKKAQIDLSLLPVPVAKQIESLLMQF